VVQAGAGKIRRPFSGRAFLLAGISTKIFTERLFDAAFTPYSHKRWCAREQEVPSTTSEGDCLVVQIGHTLSLLVVICQKRPLQCHWERTLCVSWAARRPPLSIGTSKLLWQATSLSSLRSPIYPSQRPLSHSSTAPPHPTSSHTYKGAPFAPLLRTLLSLSHSSASISPSFSIHSFIMGKKLTADQLLACAEANGYRRGAHHKEDSLRDRSKQARDEERPRCSAGSLRPVRETSPCTSPKYVR
jgi:hypothetical protein